MGPTFMESFREISPTVSKIDFGGGKALIALLHTKSSSYRNYDCIHLTGYHI